MIIINELFREEIKEAEERLFRGSIPRLAFANSGRLKLKGGFIMLEKIMILHEMKLMGIDISVQLEKMYSKYGKEEFQHAAKVSGYGFILQ